jgi:hypothetical protein
MRLFQLVTFLIAIPSLVAGQENEPAPRLSAPVPRKVTATAGVGNAMGWFGGQAEYYVARDRASLFAGLGYTLEVDEGDPSGATFALGARGVASDSMVRELRPDINSYREEGSP